MNPAQRSLVQQVTYWAPEAPDGFGQPTFAAPILLQGRWNHLQAYIRGPNGDDLLCSHEVSLSADVELEGYLALGDYTDTPDPRVLDSVTNDVGQIKNFDSRADLRNLWRDRKALAA